MYTIEQVMSVINTNSWGFAILAFTVYTIGFIQYFTSLYVTVKDKKAPFFFWQHAWYFGHDLTFVLLFNLWFNEIDFWLFKILWAGCLAFVFIEIWSLYYAIKHERNELWGKYYKDGTVTVRDAWIRGILGYAVGFILFYVIRIGIGDVMCLALMMSTNVTVALAPSFLAEERQSRKGSSVFLAIVTIIGTIFTFSPPGIGMWATAAPVFNQPWFYALGALSVCGAIRCLYVLLKLPQE